MREQLRSSGVSDTVVDDAVLILSELLSNACRHGRPLGRHSDVGDGDIRAAWRVGEEGDLTVEVTDGGGPTRPVPATPSVTARGGRGLTIIGALAQAWGVRDDTAGEVTVWALVSAGRGHDGFGTIAPGRVPSARGERPGGLDALAGPGGLGSLEGLELADALDALGDAG